MPKSMGKWGMYKVDGELPEVRAPKAPMLKLKVGGIQPTVDLREQCSPVKDQKTLGSCTACGVVSAIEFAQRKQGAGGYGNPELSVLFSYYNSRIIGGTTNADGGAILSQAVAAPLAWGVCRETEWPYDVNKLKTKPSQSAYDEALKHEPIQFARIEHGDETMRVLSQGFPVIVSTLLGYVMMEGAETGHVPVVQKTMEPAGHTMLLVGYDKNKKEWLIRNSWGPDYGMRGYAWVPDETFVAYTEGRMSWVIGDLEKPDLGKLVGASMSESIADIRDNGPSDTVKALQEKGKDLRKELQDDLDDAKKSARSRLRDAMTIKPRDDGGNNNQ